MVLTGPTPAQAAPEAAPPSPGERVAATTPTVTRPEPAQARPLQVARKAQHARAWPRRFKGRASYYGRRFAGRRTASGERFQPEGLTMAHRRLPFGTLVRVTNARNGRSVVVRVNDRGPFVRSRVADVSLGAARRLGMLRSGVVDARFEVIGRSRRSR
jgi:rare lipoprotein A